MTGEALAGWVLGVLDASDGQPSENAVRVIRARLSEVLNVPMKDLPAPAPGTVISKKAKARSAKETHEAMLAAAKGPQTGLPPEVPSDLPGVERMG